MLRLATHCGFEDESRVKVKDKQRIEAHALSIDLVSATGSLEVRESRPWTCRRTVLLARDGDAKVSSGVGDIADALERDGMVRTWAFHRSLVLHSSHDEWVGTWKPTKHLRHGVVRPDLGPFYSLKVNVEVTTDVRDDYPGVISAFTFAYREDDDAINIVNSHLGEQYDQLTP
jgi:hypothetical protein